MMKTIIVILLILMEWLMNSIDNRLCPKCLEDVNAYGMPCVEIFKEVCVSHFTSKPFLYHEEYVLKSILQPLKFLESKGYVITHEYAKNKIAVFPNSKNYKHKGFLCCCKH